MPRFVVPATLVLPAGTQPAGAKDLEIPTGAGTFLPARALAAEFGSRTGETGTLVSDTAAIASDAENAMDAQALLNELRGAATPAFRPV